MFEMNSAVQEDGIEGWSGGERHFSLSYGVREELLSPMTDQSSLFYTETG